MPIGEYLPVVDKIPVMNQFLKSVYRLARGPGPVVLDLRTKKGVIRVNAVICYEDIDTAYALRGASLGSRLVVDIGDDASFGDSNEPALHLNRAIEMSLLTRVPEIRATNSGISALVLPSGETVGETTVLTSTSRVYKIPVPLKPKPTLVKEWGDWFRWTALGLSLLIGFVFF